MRMTHPIGVSFTWNMPVGLPSVPKHIAQFAHREGIRYSMSGRSPDSRTPGADETSSHVL
jgi:hypothetical protein